MEPNDDDLKLNRLLREWQARNAPPSLDRRVLHDRPVPPGWRKWWIFLLTGSIRIPVPVGIAILALLAVMSAAMLRPARPAARAGAVNLTDFRPADDLNVRIIRGVYEPH